MSAAPPGAETVVIEIRGTAGNTIEVSGHAGAEGSQSFPFPTLEWAGTLAAPDGTRIRVAAWRGPAGWMVAAGRDGSAAMPGWAVTIADDDHGDPVLVIEAPAGTRLDKISAHINPRQVPQNAGHQYGHGNTQVNHF